jgi:hypothetical protein
LPALRDIGQKALRLVGRVVAGAEQQRVDHRRRARNATALVDPLGRVALGVDDDEHQPLDAARLNTLLVER